MLAVKGGTFLTPDKQIKDGVLLIDNGKIVYIGNDVAVPTDAEVIEASDKVIMPGMIDAHCHTGVFADGVGWDHSDGNEMTDPITPHLRAQDAVHLRDRPFGLGQVVQQAATERDVEGSILQGQLLAVDIRISQLVDPNKTAKAFIPKALFDARIF